MATQTPIGLECRQLTFERSHRLAAQAVVLSGIDAAFDAGCLTLITGPAGAGKSTLLHLLAGLLRPTAGEVWAGGQPISRWKPSHLDRWRLKVGIVFQHLHLLAERSVFENLLVRVIPFGGSPRQARRIVFTTLEEHGLRELADAPVLTLSGGQRQRVALARAMLGDPHYLLLDEPTTFQDDAGAGEMMQKWQAAAQKGACVVICAHDVRLRSTPFSSVWNLRQGRLENRS